MRWFHWLLVAWPVGAAVGWLFVRGATRFLDAYADELDEQWGRS